MLDIKELKKLDIGKVVVSPLMKEYTTYKIGGKADAMVSPKDTDSLIVLLKYLKEKQIAYKIIGNGSNLIFSDEGFDGVIIKLDAFDTLKIDKNVVTVGAGYNLMRLSLKMSRSGFSGLEFASGIPGSVGGAVFMNAGAYKSDMGYVVKSAKVLTPDYTVKTFTNKELDFHYRTSFLKQNPEYICLEATIPLFYGDKNEIMELINERKVRRITSQPLEYPSAGSVFRNPTGLFAGQLIEDLGYKGKKIGGAMVSLKHANFIVNAGDATCKDLEELISSIKKDVKEKYQVELKEEQEFVK
ncbi:MAG: UDP-N-acetylmuramate dehydrogenase [Bacilli bacterium]|nr:UDP-N-acetylmuramate dehydrogenase [Bacilli bacterium]